MTLSVHGNLNGHHTMEGLASLALNDVITIFWECMTFKGVGVADVHVAGLLVGHKGVGVANVHEFVFGGQEASPHALDKNPDRNVHALLKSLHKNTTYLLLPTCHWF